MKIYLKDKLLKAAAVLAAVIISVSLLAACAEAPEQTAPQETAQPQQVQLVSQADAEDTPDEDTLSTEVSEEKAEAEPEVKPADDEYDEDTVQQLSQLDALLADIRANVWIGTAGSSLRAAQEAVKLMNWSVNTPLNDEQIADCVKGYISGLSEDEAAEFEMQLDSVDGMYKLLLEGGQEELMDDAGITESDIPFGSDSIEAVESIMRAAGLR